MACSMRAASVALATAALFATASAVPAQAASVGYEAFAASTSSASITGEKPQSKVFYHDGSYWAVLRGPSGVAFYELVDEQWQLAPFMDAVLATTGTADVLCEGSNLYVLVYASYPKLFEYVYDAPQRVWKLLTGFPVSVPRLSGSETMVLAKDSAGRLWAAAEGNSNICAYYTTTPDHRTWATKPVVLQTGVDPDDIASIVAFGGDKIGVFWSDQLRDEFAFRVHYDNTSPTIWDAKEIADAGLGHADDHISLKADSHGRVYAVTKDAFDHMQVHRRAVDGTWTTKFDVLEAIGTRGILLLSESDGLAYVLYTRWGVSPDRIEYRFADLETLEFGSSTVLMLSANSLNNVTSMKQPLPPGSLMAMSEGSSHVFWNGWGQPASPSDSSSTLRPTGLTTTLLPSSPPVPSRVHLAWAAPAALDSVTGYNIYRLVDGGPYEKLNAEPAPSPSFTDSSLVFGSLCYRVTALYDHESEPEGDDEEDGEDDGEHELLESGPSNSVCVAFMEIPGEPPPPPTSLQVVRVETTLSGPARGVAAFPMDEGSGQSLMDATGLGHEGILGAALDTERADPLWTTGVSGSALRFNGMTHRVRVADASDLRMSQSFTLEGWIQKQNWTAGSAGCIVAKGDAGRRNYSLQLDSSSRIEFRWQVAGGVNHGAVSSVKILDVRWHHIAAVYDQSLGENRLYLDGQLVKRVRDTGIPVLSADPVYIGARSEGKSLKSFFSGSLDLVRISSGVTYTDNFTPPTAYGTGDASLAVQLEWQRPAGLPPVGYNVYAEYNGAAPVKLNAAPLAANSFRDGWTPLGTACYRVSSLNSEGLEGDLCAAVCVTNAVGKPQGSDPEATPRPTSALVVSPNPFNPATRIRFRLLEPGPVSLAIFNVRGHKVATLVDGPMHAGEQQLGWEGKLDDGTTAASGVYFLQLRAGAVNERRKLIMLK